MIAELFISNNKERLFKKKNFMLTHKIQTFQYDLAHHHFSI
jgi:hypothetical protein